MLLHHQPSYSFGTAEEGERETIAKLARILNREVSQAIAVSPSKSMLTRDGLASFNIRLGTLGSQANS